ncbi:MAG TPA: trigger factor [Desulfobacteraceae bacterium]|nr:trigger factor [bacterium BMS3Abin13]HDK44548.1 trigger factor [Desulfobacteraceae bacterium]HDL98666.1 trigger factor [Desulfobacteraceae bacterium]HDO30743.1 trigger factor [Desulfobacteraceae bacterium]HDZ76241.1 trigger factor [Desulfobacteraceae bacterium]
MDVVVETVTNLTRRLSVTLPEEEVSKELNKAYGKLKKDVKIKGFRRGKVPQSVLEKNFRRKVEAEVGEQLVQATYFDAVEQEKIDPVVHPEIKSHTFNEDGTFVYVAEVDVRPVFDLGEYKGLEIERPPIEVTDDEVAEKLEALRREHAVLRRAADDHAIVPDDIAIVDFQGFHNDAPMPEVHNEDYSVDVGSGSLGKEFEEKIVGLKRGDKTLYDVDFPPEYPSPVMAGKTVTFKVDVKDIKERLKPELDDEFAKDVNGDYETIDDLKNAVRQELLEKKEAALDGDLDDRIMQKLIENHDFDIPVRLVLYELEEMEKQLEANLKQSGLTLESAGIKREDLVARNREVAEKRVRGDFLLKKIAEVEEIKVEDADIENGYQRIAGQYKMTVPEVKQYFQRREEILPFVNELLNEKILRFMREAANIIEVPAGPQEAVVESGEAESGS